jgi:hypothetical protein
MLPLTRSTWHAVLRRSAPGVLQLRKVHPQTPSAPSCQPLHAEPCSVPANPWRATHSFWHAHPADALVFLRVAWQHVFSVLYQRAVIA